MRRGSSLAAAATGRAVAAVLLSLVPLLPGAGSAAGVTADIAAQVVTPAQAEIVIEPDHVEPGARDVTLVFRMTDVDPAAPTVRFQLFLPTGRPLVGVTAPAPPGWTAELTRTVLPAPASSVDGPVLEIVSAVTWTASSPPAAGAVEFPLHVDLMPSGAGPVRFQAACTDAAGRTVEWADAWAEGGPKPAHDALKLALGAAPGPPVAPAGHADHHGDRSGIAAGPGTPTSGGIATTVAGLLAFAAALSALLTVLSRRQRRRFETGSSRPPNRTMEP